MTEADLAERLARDLGPLAVDAQWSTTATPGQAYGHYTDTIADAMQDMGIDGLLAGVAAGPLRQVQDLALLHSLGRLEVHYTLQADTTVGQDLGSLGEKLSQVQKAIATVRKRVQAAITAGAAVASGDVRKATGAVVRGRRRPDYSLGAGDEADS